MLLLENINVLNQLWGKYGIFFENSDNIIKIIESQNFLLNNNPLLKERLAKKLGMRFNSTNKWHIDGKNFQELKVKKLRLNSIRSLGKLIELLKGFLNKIDDSRLEQSIIGLFKKYPQYYQCPASKFHHHDYKFGLLEHSIEVLEYSMLLYHKNSTYKPLNKDLIIAGAILHDFGKVNCYSLSPNEFVQINETYYLEGHINNAIKIVSQEIKSDLLDDIVHIIGTHHRFKEWGSSISPIKYEAWIIHIADYISSQIF